jgi:hypothetical protein
VKRLASRLAGFLAKVELQARPFAPQPSEHRGQQERGDGRDHPEPQLAVERLAFGAGELGKLLGLADRPGRLVGDLLAERGEADHPASALDQRDSKQGLELAKARPKASIG